MEDLSFTWTLDHALTTSFDDVESVRPDRGPSNRPMSYKAESLMEALGAYAAVLECSDDCGAAKG